MADILDKARLSDLRHHSNFDLSERNLLSCDPGPLYPVLCKEVYPGDFFKIHERCDITTSPLQAPLKGGFMQEIAYFFVPTRLYQQLLDVNRLTFDAAAELPTCYAPGLPVPAQVPANTDALGGTATNTDELSPWYWNMTTASSYYGGILSGLYGNIYYTADDGITTIGLNAECFATAPCSLVELMNASAANSLHLFNTPSNTTSSYPAAELMNEVPFLGYVDIVRNYYSDPNVPFIPMIGTSFRRRVFNFLNDVSSNYNGSTPYSQTQNISSMDYYTNIPLSFLDDLILNIVALSARNIPAGSSYEPVINSGTSDAMVFSGSYDNYQNAFDSYNAVFDGSGFPTSTMRPNVQYVRSFSAAALWNALAISHDYLDAGPCPWGYASGEIASPASSNPTILLGVGNVPYSYNYDLSDSTNTNWGQYGYMFRKTWSVPCGGLFLRTLRPDLFTAFFDKTNYDDLVLSVTINGDTDESGNQQLTYNQIRVGSHLQAFNDRLFMSNGRYSGFVETEWCVRCDTHLCIPEILGVHRSVINFRQITSTSNAANPEVSSDTRGLGDLAGQGYGTMSGRPITFSAREHGYLIAIYSIAPLVSYGDAHDPLFDKETLADFYSPALDNIGFQPLPAKWMSSGTLRYSSQRSYNSGSTIETLGTYDQYVTAPGVNSMSDLIGNIGYQPSWIELTTSVDRVHGEFVPSGELNYWAITRNFQSSNNVSSVVKVGGSDRYRNEIRYPRLCDYWPFVYPYQYEYPFTLQAYDVAGSPDPQSLYGLKMNAVPGIASNFHADFDFSIQVKRKKSRSIQPTLA